MRAFALATAMTFAVGAAHAEPTARDRETARALLDQGDKKFAANDFQAALKAYQAAYALINVPTTGVEVAKAQAAVGLLVEARDTALGVTRFPQAEREPAPFAKARAKADDLAQKLLTRIPSIEVDVVGPPPAAVHITIDGEALPEAAVALAHKVNPGRHTVVATAAGFSEATKDLTVAEGASEKITLTLKPTAAVAAVPAKGAAPSDAPSPKKQGGGSTLTYVGFGVGGVGLAVGAVTGFLSLSKASSAKTHCTGNVCTPEAQSDIDASKSTGMISNIGFAVGIVGVAVAIVGIATSGGAPPEKASARIVPLIGPGGAGIAGRF